ncbi:MAG: TIGR03885 family FMN-dependent LLM class oxidoreductase [Devosia nanyangense]|nr:TIGR03885 family FMN-dependent LLM class oxidoreductase [Devosia nanyangense]
MSKLKIGYHASHEQFSPQDLLKLVQLAQSAGFDCAKCSDHFHPWSERQGQSGAAWPWLGAALQATVLPFGVVTAPGYRYHPAIIAQSIATLASLFESRLWVALGSGEALNEAITGEAWPEKTERNARLLECFTIIRALLKGETISFYGRVTVVEAKLYSRPSSLPALYGAALTAETAAFLAPNCDGLLTAGRSVESIADTIRAFRDAGGAGKPVIIQSAHCWAPTLTEATNEAVHQWGACAIGGGILQDLRRPADFDRIAASVSVEQVARAVVVSHDLSEHTDHLRAVAALEPAEIHIHPVGRNQKAFIEAFGHQVLPELR